MLSCACRPYLTDAEETRLAALFEDAGMAERLSTAPHTFPSSNCNGTGAAESSTTGAEHLRRWAEEGLAEDGELIEGKHSHAELLLLAHAILVAAPGESLHA